MWSLIKANYKKFVVRSSAHVKRTLMQIWKLPYIIVFIQKQHPQIFAFFFPRSLKFFDREGCKFLRK